MRAGCKSVHIEDIAKVVNGGTPNTKVADYWGGEHLWITPAEMGGLESPYMTDSRRKLSDSGLQHSSATLVPPYSVILSTRAPIGHLIINAVPMAFNQGCRGIVPSEKVHYKYLYYFFSFSVDLLNDLGSGTTFKELAAGKLRKVKIPVPPLPEQKRIVAILDEAFAGIATAVANTEKNLANAGELFESYLNSVFSQRGEGWVETELSRLITISHGFSFKGADFKTSSDMSKPIVLTPGNYTKASDLKFSAKNTKRFYGKVPNAYLFDEGDLTVVMTDLSSKMKILGKPAFVNRPDILHNQRIGRVILKTSDLDKRFLYYFLRTSIASEEIRRTATGTMVKHTAPKRILSLRIPMAKSRSKQEEITSLLDVLSIETSRAEGIFQQKLSALAELKQSLLQKAFSSELTAVKEASTSIIKKEEVA